MQTRNDPKHDHDLACLSDRHQQVLEVMEKVADEKSATRLGMCLECPSLSNCRCDLSSLPVRLAAASKYEECPLGKWGADVKLGDTVAAAASVIGLKSSPGCGCSGRHAAMNRYTPKFISKALTWLSRLAGRDTR